MKIFLWLLTAAGTLVCLTSWLISELVVRSMRDTLSGVPLPEITRLVLVPHGWLLATPVPWVTYACVLTLRRELRASDIYVFTGSLILFVTALTCVVTVGLLLPYLPRHP